VTARWLGTILQKGRHEPGAYDLSIRGYDARLEPSGQEFSHIAIAAGEVHSYVLNFAPATGVTVVR